MESEALTKVKTMRQIRSGLDLARKHKAKTTNSLFQDRRQIEHLESLADRGMSRILEKERKRFAAQEKAVNGSREQLLEFRERLAKSINRNRALTELRLELQRERSGGNSNMPPRVAKPATDQAEAEPNIHHIGLKY